MGVKVNAHKPKRIQNLFMSLLASALFSRLKNPIELIQILPGSQGLKYTSNIFLRPYLTIRGF
jgi:hypothetical protein